MPYDYTDAPPPRDIDLIPHGTIATIVMHIRAGNVGEDGILKRSKDGGCEMLDVEFTVFDGPYKGRKFWEYWVLAGTTDGHAWSVGMNRGTLKAILDSALGLNPDDKSPEARKARMVSLKQFEGVPFIAKIGIEKGKAKNDGSGENWPDKNVLASVITPDKKDWHPVEQPPPFNGGGTGAAAAAPSEPATAAAPIARPQWADEPASS
jgi:hypothetical protein